jgi:hypothetical protein
MSVDELAQRRAELWQNSKGALRQGVSLETRAADRDEKEQFWMNWFRVRMSGGTEVAQWVPAALAELEERMHDEIARAISEFKADLKKAVSK